MHSLSCEAATLYEYEVPNLAKEGRETIPLPVSLFFLRLAPVSTQGPIVAEHPVNPTGEKMFPYRTFQVGPWRKLISSPTKKISRQARPNRLELIPAGSTAVNEPRRCKWRPGGRKTRVATLKQMTTMSQRKLPPMFWDRGFLTCKKSNGGNGAPRCGDSQETPMSCCMREPTETAQCGIGATDVARGKRRVGT